MVYSEAKIKSNADKAFPLVRRH